MQVVMGGFAQGKLEYVLRNMCPEGSKVTVIDEDSCRNICPEEDADIIIINHLHLMIKGIPDTDKAEETVKRIIRSCEEKADRIIIICDELGCGIVPADPADRRFRENTGRVLCRLASEADEVIRIVCGIGMKLK